MVGVKKRKIYSYLGFSTVTMFKLVPEGTHGHDKFIKPSQLIAWAEESQLKCIDASGIHYNPVTENHKLAANLDVNYILCCQKV